MNQQGRHRAQRSRAQIPLVAAIVGLLCLGVCFGVRSADSHGHVGELGAEADHPGIDDGREL